MINKLIIKRRELLAHGELLGRDGLAQRVQELVAQYIANDNSYKGAMQLAGQLEVLAEAASYDEYWMEQVRRGHITEVQALERRKEPQGR